MKKVYQKKLPIWLICVIFVAATLLLNLRYWKPITEDSGERFTLTLEEASHVGNTIVLDFGTTDDFKLPYAEAFDALLEDEALGREYDILANYQPMRRNRDYYDVYALSDADGTVYLTVAQSEAIRQAMLPKRLALTLGLDLIACTVITLRLRANRKRAASEDTPEKEESP